ncbi:hypothetical protein ACFY36_49110 [Actinoplanes sp. NPDC000266]
MIRTSLVVAAVLSLVLGAAAPAAALASSDVTWSVVPATAAGPDGRRVVDLEIGAGEKATEHIAVTNHTAKPVAFLVDANDGYLTASGLFDMRAADVRPVDGGSWITTAGTVTVAGGATVVVPVTVQAPAHATPGDHPAGVTASLTTGAGQVRVQNRVGVRFNIRVTGALVEKLAVTGATATYRPNWNPFRPGAVDVSYTVANQGNVRASAGFPIRAGGRTAAQPGTARAREVLPGGSRDFTTSLSVWPLGRITTEVGGTTVTTWALPLPQGLLVLALLLGAYALRAARRRRQAHLQRLIAQVRAEMLAP